VSKGLLVLLLWFFLLLPGSSRAIWYFNKNYLLFKWKGLLAHMQVCRRIGGAHAFQAARVTPPNGENYAFVLEAPHVSAPFKQRLPMKKIALSHWKGDCIILLLVWRMLTVVGRFVAYETFFLSFFLFFFYLSSP
jgi:hypothetical protein